MKAILIMKRLIVLVKPLIGYMILAIMMGVAGHLCATFITVLGVYGLFHLEIWKNIILFLIAFALLRGALRYLEQMCNHYIAFKLLAHIRHLVFKKLRTLCPAKLEGKDKGNLISLITSDIELLEVFYAHTISPIIIALLFSLFMTLWIGRIHDLLGIVAFISYGVIGIGVPLFINKQSQDTAMHVRNKSANLSSTVLDSLRGLQEIIQYNQGKQKLNNILHQTDDLLYHEEELKHVTGMNQSLTNALIFILDLLMLSIASFLYMKALISLDGLILSTVALMSSFGPVVALANLGSTLQATLASGSRVLSLLDEKSVVEDIEEKEEINFDGLDINNVSFSYNEEPIIEDVTLSIEKGKITGIIGKSGTGKSTLLKLMMRFWENQKGTISISNKEINEINTTNLRHMQSYVTQETHLFHDTIKNNIKIAKLDASDEDIITACKKASIHDFIMSLEKGYDTMVGELGDTLSGGQIQRLGLARAFLHDGDLLLLDEPTSNLDSLSEAMILKSLKQYHKTVVLVTHRKSTLRIADNIYEVKHEYSR